MIVVDFCVFLNDQEKLKLKKTQLSCCWQIWGGTGICHWIYIMCFKIVCRFLVMWQLLGWWWDHVQYQLCTYLERVVSQHPRVDGDFFCSIPQQLLDDNSEGLVQPRAPHRGIAGCLRCREVRSRVLGRDQLVWRKTGHRSAQGKEEQRSH